jgi:MFS family permease
MPPQPWRRKERLANSSTLEKVRSPSRGQGLTARCTALRAFRYRSFRIFFAGQGLSILGTWMQTIATSWLVYRLTGSAFMLGLATAALQFPMLFIAPVAGVWADRLDRRRMLIVVQALASVQALALAALTWTGAVQVWHILAFALCLGTINAFETPTRQAFLLDMVENKTDLPNAIALQSMLFNSARFVGRRSPASCSRSPARRSASS